MYTCKTFIKTLTWTALAGTESVPGIDISKISEVLLGIKGLGAKRVECIVAALEKELG